MSKLLPRMFSPRTQLLPTRSITPLATRQFSSSSRALAEDHSDPAFSKQETRPEEQQRRGEEATKGDSAINATPNVNPANPESSKPRDPQEGGSQGSQREDGGGGIQRDGQSGGGSPRKSGGGKSG